MAYLAYIIHLLHYVVGLNLMDHLHRHVSRALPTTVRESISGLHKKKFDRALCISTKVILESAPNFQNYSDEIIHL